MKPLERVVAQVTVEEKDGEVGGVVALVMMLEDGPVFARALLKLGIQDPLDESELELITQSLACMNEAMFKHQLSQQSG